MRVDRFKMAHEGKHRELAPIQHNVYEEPVSGTFVRDYSLRSTSLESYNREHDEQVELWHD